MKTIPVEMPVEGAQPAGGLYILAIPGKLWTELSVVAEAQGLTVSTLVANTLQKLIQEHRGGR